MCNHSPLYRRQLNEGFRHRSNNTSFPLSRMDLGFWFRYGVHFFLWARFMQNLSATSKIIDIDTLTNFVLHKSD